jgi:hypothetical protein
VSHRSKPALIAIASLVLVSSGAAVGFRGDDPDSGSTPAAPVTDAARTEAPPLPPEVLVVRRRGGVPVSWDARMRRTPGVTAVARTERTQMMLQRSRRAGGATVDAAPAGFAIPLDALVVRPAAYAAVLPQARGGIRALRRGRVLLSRSSAKLRRLAAGDRLTVTGGGTFRVAGVVDDDLVGLAEIVLTRGDAAGRGNSSTGQLLIATTDPRRAARRIPRDDGMRIRTLSPTLRTAPRRIARPLELKTRFGEFAVGLPYGSDWIRIEPGWLRRNVVTRSVPILGPVSCNRRLFQPLTRALRTLQRRGLAHVVDRADYAGCYAPRRIPGSGSLSLHAWGLAIDLNAAANPRLGDSRQDRRLVRAMEEAGFTWGGRWPTVPDPMHFELHSLPGTRE